MSRTSIDHTGYSSEGEIYSTADMLTIDLDRLDPIKLRPGRRVVVLTEEEFRQLTEEAAYCPKCDDA